MQCVVTLTSDLMRIMPHPVPYGKTWATASHSPDKRAGAWASLKGAPSGLDSKPGRALSTHQLNPDQNQYEPLGMVISARALSHKP